MNKIILILLQNIDFGNQVCNFVLESTESPAAYSVLSTYQSTQGGLML